MRVTSRDHEIVSAAVGEAERGTDGEIVTVIAARSDKYHDVAAHWAVVAMLLPPAILALRPDWLLGLLSPFVEGWGDTPGLHLIITALLIVTALTFLLALLVLRAPALRLLLTPPATKTRRVRARALELFRVGTERRTRARTGVLIYLSLAEHRAELIADAAIHGQVAPEVWGEAMADLIVHVRAGRIGDGMAAAVARVGTVLHEQFPRSPGDANELPDRLVEL